jgi:hypothetical protein
MNKLLKDAIADAKAVRETALANAKYALEEAFAPKLQSMLSHKIKEEMEEDGTEGEEVSDEEKMEVAKMQNLAGLTNEEDGDEDYSEEEAPEEGGDEDYSEEEAPEEGGDEDYSEEGEEDATDADLEEILRELEGESEEDEMEEMEEPEMEDDSMETESEDPESAMDEEIDLEEIINALREEDEEEEETEETESKMEAVTSDLNEAYSVIKFLRSKLNEVNLLNAKLLFVNKLFRKGELTESQKVKIIETFDRAKNVREAKLIYATLSESVNNKSIKKPVKNKMTEGLASAPQKKTNIISESAGVFNRFKTLVDYNKI